jgi:alkylresorcinol/alkylpyrone synthase
VLVAGSDSPAPGPEIIATRSTFYPGTEDVMGWDISEKGFSIVLSPRVPDVIRENLRADVDAFLADWDLKRSDIGAWIMHTGGPKILEATQDALGISRDELSASWDCLRRVGNLSSASVLVVLEEFMTNRRPPPATWSVLGAMGPGFCSELILLRW